MFAQIKKLLLISTVIFFSSMCLADNPKVSFETSMGNITLELFAEESPVTVKNFLQYIDEDFYIDTQFHRVISGFMVQGGGFTKQMSKKQNHEPIINESANGLSNKRGTIAMARTQAPDSATSQFFINLVDNLSLNQVGNRAGYTVFGEVTEGMDIVDSMAKTKTGMSSGHRDVPIEPILILSAKRL
ncbi:peptidylprolyl isomerase [Neptunomonas antarctica]|uniref:Peptidyl-prolyl cis-trans isomerase n=1 Tax=Neptunomonas antarctica TaxID=619304 RepID=A0A1N7M6S3_9GAMM|nr:peptidylprolyl isomerase [Neptunomonas antarctica]SIS81699.1 peptidyl-prolyl cis-trans isomerase A (cyclophilin A) [Neptunomonas antarctica]